MEHGNAGWLANIDENDLLVLEEDSTRTTLTTGIWRILFLDTREPLPQVLSVTLSSSPSPALFNNAALVRGTVCLQDWDVDGLISGEVKGETRPNFPGIETLTRFWVDMGEQP